MLAATRNSSSQQDAAPEHGSDDPVALLAPLTPDQGEPATDEGCRQAQHKGHDRRCCIQSAGGVLKQRSTCRIDLDAALGEEFFDVAVGQAKAQVPADREHHHLGWEAKPAKVERGGIDWRDERVVLMFGVSPLGPLYGQRNRA